MVLKTCLFGLGLNMMNIPHTGMLRDYILTQMPFTISSYQLISTFHVTGNIGCLYLINAGFDCGCRKLSLVFTIQMRLV